MTFTINEQLEQIDGCFDSVGNHSGASPVISYSEEEFRKARGNMNKKRGSVALPAPHAYQTEINDAAGPAMLADRHIQAEKESKIIQLAGPAGFKRGKNDYLWTYDSGGSMPPAPPSNFYQMGKPGIPQARETRSFLQIVRDEAVTGIKESAYLTLTEWPSILRRMIFDKISSMGTIPDLLSSLWAMGAYAGPIKNWETDLLYDRLELIINQRHEVLGARTYNVRKPTPLILWLREGQKEIIPRGGRPSEFSDLDMTREGNLAHFNLDHYNQNGEMLGGVPVGVDNIQYDSFYTESETLDWALHKELKKGLSPNQVQKDLVQFSLSHYAYTQGSAKLDPLDKHEPTGDYIWRLTLPPASILGITQWDSTLFAKTLTRVIGAYAIMHWPYYAFEKLGGYLHIPEKFVKNVVQSEVDSVFKPTRYIIDRSRG